MADSIPLAHRGPSPQRFTGSRASSPRSDQAVPHVISLEDVAEVAKDIHPRWKRELYLLLEHPTSSPSAFIIHFAATALIVVSAAVTVLETIPSSHAISGSVWFGLETTLVVLFTVEYIARTVAHSNTWVSCFKWAISFFGIIDLLGILPYYLEIALGQDTSTFFRFTILRTFRLLRVFRPFRYNNTILLTIEVMYLSFRRSEHALLALAFFVVMVLVVFSTLLYFAERGSWDETLGIFINSDGDPSQFASIPAAAWFVLVTITTVGYGEITPRSFLGRLITVPLLVFGLLLIALPTFVLGREFSAVWDLMKESEAPTDSQEERYQPTPLSSPLVRHPGAARSTWDVRLDTLAADAMMPLGTRNRRQSERDRAELSSQITELRAIVEAQGDMLRRMMELLDGKGKQKAVQFEGEQSSPWS
ncbi:ion transporter [Phanerochaete sordida]|uniref:Ion transporter n=1 Tax=Phanerochaete sordida TaxID=48140 RepID=A0A9P3LBR2_9APHY|nr:ion transporter [Phanerochaete sordida]